MNDGLLALWSKCRDFVGATCAGRDASHGLVHMETVTQRALLILSLEPALDHGQSDGRGSALGAAAASRVLRARVVVLGMLHDVCDHKYDADGALEARVQGFVEELLHRSEDLWAQVFCDVEGANDSGAGGAGSLAATALTSVATVMGAISAISFSKEQKSGMRWFEEAVFANNRSWILARDCVSDADKLEAIGLNGLKRCLAYNRERVLHSNKARPAEELVALLAPATLLREVRAHAQEKLLRLLDEFVVTRGAKFLGAPLQQEMIEALADDAGEWMRE